jgi:hypothetical protein
VVKFQLADALHPDLDIVQQTDLVIVNLFIHVLQQLVQPHNVLPKNSQIYVLLRVQSLRNLVFLLN